MRCVTRVRNTGDTQMTKRRRRTLIIHRIAKVAVSAAVYSIDKPYDYGIPPDMLESAVPGVRVSVTFGRGNRSAEGVILSVEDGQERPGLKCITAVLDEHPVLTAEQIKLALWMRDRFFCTVYDALHAMLPAGMWFRDGERRVNDKTADYAVLAVDGEEALIAAGTKKLRSPMQASVLRLMSEIGEASVNEICYFTGASRQSVAALKKQGYIDIIKREIYRRPDIKSVPAAGPLSLNEEQQAVFEDLCSLLDSGSPVAALLYGVTGSGKTSVYIKLIQETIKRGKRAITLVPEIALTPQLVGIFSSYFGDNVAVLHSSLSIGERYDEWKRIKSGAVSVVVGTRSAIFAPCEDLGLIIIDEEQESTYKSENSPRYHARDIAKYRCARSNAMLLLGSATPSVESMHAAQIGKYKLFTLKKRYNDMGMPQVLIADMRQELKRGNSTSLSSVLIRELEKNIEAGEQSILFINRRGASGLVVCGECGTTHTCPNCSVSLTYHSANRRLMCHYCGYSEPFAERCPECGGRLKFTGVGTQKVEEELSELLPGVGVLRMDTDTVSAARSHEKILDKFKIERVPILVGTQMVTKGLDFENVTLVGVLSADQSLFVGDYRAHERTFSLITQVVGRSGRGSKAGRAVIQTFMPENEVIRLAAKQDYMAFYKREIPARKVIGCPPICDMFTVTVSGQDEAGVLRACMKLRGALGAYLGGTARVLGPAPAPVMRVNNRYRYRITVSCESTREVRNTLSHLMREAMNDSENRGIAVFADVNPLDS